MNILFLTILNIDSIEDRNIYTDLLRKFKEEGHDISIVCPTERKFNRKTHLTNQNGVDLLKVLTLNLQKTNLIEKGIGTLLFEYQFLSGIKRYFRNKKFDLVIYSTPPITFSKVISYLKSTDNVFSYLLLKDIFPQNAVDLNMIKKNSLLHKYFKYKEKKLYEISDKIGCMSPANVNYLSKHHPNLNAKLEVNPNSLEITKWSDIDKNQIRVKYNLPLDKTIFVYGGNLGKPQGIEFLLDIVKASLENINNAYFLIIGNGTEYESIRNWFLINKPKNAKLINYLPKKEYDQLVKCSDVGMVFLNPNFTIPNFPSRLLTYLEYKLPVFSATDTATDIPFVIEKNKFGYSVISGDLNSSINKISRLANDSILVKDMGENAYNFFKENYSINISYSRIINAINV